MEHYLQVIVAYLITQAAGARMDEHHNLLFEEPEDLGNLLVVYLVYHIDLQKVVARTEGSHLLQTPFNSPAAHLVGVSLLHCPIAFYMLQVPSLPKTLLDRPSGTLNQCVFQLGGSKLTDGSRGTYPAGNSAEQPLDERLYLAFYLIRFKIGSGQATPTVDVVANPSR